MLRELFIPISEALFWFTGGVLLVNTLWFFVWVLVGAVLMFIPFFLAVYVGKNKINTLPAIVFIITFFPMLMLVISPGIVQLGMIEECRTVEAQVTIEGVTETREVRQCRAKENYYDTEYGPWKEVSNN